MRYLTIVLVVTPELVATDGIIGDGPISRLRPAKPTVPQVQRHARSSVGGMATPQGSP